MTCQSCLSVPLPKILGGDESGDSEFLSFDQSPTLIIMAGYTSDSSLTAATTTYGSVPLIAAAQLSSTYFSWQKVLTGFQQSKITKVVFEQGSMLQFAAIIESQDYLFFVTGDIISGTLIDQYLISVASMTDLTAIELIYDSTQIYLLLHSTLQGFQQLVVFDLATPGAISRKLWYLSTTRNYAMQLDRTSSVLFLGGWNKYLSYYRPKMSGFTVQTSPPASVSDDDSGGIDREQSLTAANFWISKFSIYQPDGKIFGCTAASVSTPTRQIYQFDYSGTFTLPSYFHEYLVADLGECIDIYTVSASTAYMTNKDFRAPSFTLRLIKIVITSAASSLTIMAEMSLDTAINVVSQAKYFSWGKGYYVGSTQSQYLNGASTSYKKAVIMSFQESETCLTLTAGTPISFSRQLIASTQYMPSLTDFQCPSIRLRERLLVTLPGFCANFVQPNAIPVSPFDDSNSINLQNKASTCSYLSYSSFSIDSTISYTTNQGELRVGFGDVTSRCASEIIYVLKYFISNSEQATVPSFISIDGATNEIVIITTLETDVGSHVFKLRAREGPLSLTFYRFVDISFTLTIISSSVPVTPTPPDPGEVIQSPPYFVDQLSSQYVKIGSSKFYYLPAYENPNSNKVLVEIILRPEKSGLIRYQYQNNLMVLSPQSNSYEGEYSVYITLKDSITKTLASFYNFQVIVTPQAQESGGITGGQNQQPQNSSNQNISDAALNAYIEQLREYYNETKANQTLTHEQIDQLK